MAFLTRLLGHEHTSTGLAFGLKGHILFLGNQKASYLFNSVICLIAAICHLCYVVKLHRAWAGRELPDG